MCSVSAVILCLDGKIELMRQSQSRQRQAHLLRLCQRDSHIFDEMFHEKSGVEIVVHNSRTQI